MTDALLHEFDANEDTCASSVDDGAHTYVENYKLPKYSRGLYVEAFCGAGGASMAMEMAFGFRPDVAINHSDTAIAMHKANSGPETLHLPHNVWKVNLKEIIGENTIAYLHASPDCRQFSAARGGRITSKSSRDLAWVVIRWLRELKPYQYPLMISLENVKEFQQWGPLIPDGKGDFVQDPERKGELFKLWCSKLRAFGYSLDFQLVRACDFGSPTIRTRLYIIARLDRARVRWPKPTHGDPKSLDVLDGKLKPWPVAADIIDWDRKTPSIFMDRAQAKDFKKATGLTIKRPLAYNSMKRIAFGTKRYVLDNPERFIVTCNHSGSEFRGQNVNDPFLTVAAARDAHGLVNPELVPSATIAPHITKFRTNSIGSSAEEPVPTVTANSFVKRPGCGTPLGVVAPLLVRTAHGEKDSKGKKRGRGDHAVSDPLPTVLGTSDSAVITPVLAPTETLKAGVISFGQHGGRSRSPADPLHTIEASTKNTNEIIAASFIKQDFGQSVGRPADAPAPAITAGGGGHADIMMTYLAQHNTDMIGHHPNEPVSTLTAKGCNQAVVAAHMLSLKGSDRRAGPATDPLPAVCAAGQHSAVISVPLISAYYGTETDSEPANQPLRTTTAKARFSLVEPQNVPRPLTDEQLEKAYAVADFLRAFGCWDEREVVTIDVKGVEHILVDIGMRMLTPRELARAMDFPEDYILDAPYKGGTITETDQRHKIGNAVCRHPLAAILKANWPIDPACRDRFAAETGETPLLQAAE